MYRVVSNEAVNHEQWIVVRDAPPLMVAGPFGDERTATLHCDALNREYARRVARPKSAGAFDRFITAVAEGWCFLTVVDPRGRLN